MSTLKKRALDVRVGDHVHMPASEMPMAVTKVELQQGKPTSVTPMPDGSTHRRFEPKVRLDYINRTTQLVGFIVLPPTEWVIVDEWPYGPRDFHEECCKLHAGALECDCKASDASDKERGRGA